jgi:hypothetical protein
MSPRGVNRAYAVTRTSGAMPIELYGEIAKAFCFAYI